MTTSKIEKKPRKKATKSLDIKALEVTQTDLAYCLGITTANITGFLQNGLLKKNANGKMDLVESVSTYCRSLRERKAGSNKTSIDEETAKWKLQNIKIKNRDWRMQRDRMVATEILKTLSESMGELRELAKLNPALCDEIDAIVSRIGRIDVDSISLAVEGDDEEDDE